MTREDAIALDAADPLADLRDRFVIEDGGPLYVDGNSLGRLPATTPLALGNLITQWGSRLVGAWDDWITWPAALGDRLAGVVLGARPGEVLVCDSVTVNLYKLAGAALAVRGGAIVADPGDFPTDRYVLEGLAAQHGRELRHATADTLEEALAGGGVAVVVLSHVDYRSGARADLARLTAAAHAAGALALWDLSHSAGAVEVGLGAAGADLAVGCTYKYLNGGPGAPGYLYVRSELLPELRSPIQGWFGQADQFAMGAGYAPAAGIERFLAGTPPILGLATLTPSLELIEDAGMAAITAKAAALTGYAIELLDGWPAELGATLATPREAAGRGAHVSIAHPEAWRICRALIELERVIPDFRLPDLVRVGLSPLTTSFRDVFDALAATRRVIEDRLYERMPQERSRVI